MPLFLSEEEFRLCAHDASLVAERADGIILDLRRQLDAVRADAEARAASIDCLQAENGQLVASIERHLSELAEARAEKHQLDVKATGKDIEIKRLKLLAQKDLQIMDSTIQTYFQKIVDLTDSLSSKEAIIHENEAELSRRQAAYDHLSQERDLIRKHNAWLNEELYTKVNSLIELRKKYMDIEVDMSVKVADLEKQLDDSSKLYKRSKDRVLELEGKLTSLEEEVHLSKDSVAANEERICAKLSTVTRLVELHKANSEEWSKKAGELEGVIKALETHLNHVENGYKEKLEKEVSLRKDYEKEITALKDKLEKCEVEIESARVNDKDEVDVDSQHMIAPRIPTGISGTALAASLLRDGWSLAKMYAKYQETADALRHEKWGRKHSEAILERVVHEIEEKAELILEERVEHERTLEAYSLMDQRLQQARLEIDNFESTLRMLKFELKRRDEDYIIAEKEINGLQKQVILQSETIQEFTNTSKELSRLQEEVSKLLEFSEAQKIENDLLKSSGEKVKVVLQELKDEAERKYNELNEQNKILHNRLESLHVRLADRKLCSNINITYVEQAETEASLLKQEKFHLQSQLETAQYLRNSQPEDSRAAAPSSNPSSSRKHAAPSSASDEVLKRPRHR